MTRHDLENNITEDNLRAIGKITRDWRDLDLFPKEKEVLKELYLSWKQLIETYIKIIQTRKKAESSSVIPASTRSSSNSSGLMPVPGFSDVF